MHGFGRKKGALASVTLLLLNDTALTCVDALNVFQKFFKGNAMKSPISSKPAFSVNRVESLQDELLGAVSNTNNGKTATLEEKTKVLQLVGELEGIAPPPEDLLSNPDEACRLDGCWYLQYTSPSDLQLGEDDQFPDAWKPASPVEPTMKDIPLKNEFDQSGAISAEGIKVDASNREVQQNINVAKSRVSNVIEQGFGTLSVSGDFRQSDLVPRRVIIGFDELEITLDQLGGLKLNFGFIFSLVALARGTKDNGWLETTFVSDRIRIGRGNKGTMFVLTRELGVVTA